MHFCISKAKPAVTSVLIGLNVLTLALWFYPFWLPKAGIHLGNERLAIGGLIGEENMGGRYDIDLSFGNAATAGYSLDILGRYLKFCRTSKWRRTDRVFQGDITMAPVLDNYIQYDLGGIGFERYHQSQADFDDKWIACVYGVKVSWLAEFGGLALAAWIAFLVVGRFSKARRGFPMDGFVGTTRR